MSNSKRKALETIFPRLQKLLAHLGNANEGEGEAARQSINRLLKKAGLDWHDLATLLSENRDPLLEIVDKLLAKDSDILIKLGLSGAVFFHSADGPFADVVVNGHRKTLPLSGSDFVEWL